MRFDMFVPSLSLRRGEAILTRIVHVSYYIFSIGMSIFLFANIRQIYEKSYLKPYADNKRYVTVSPLPE